MNTFDSIPRDGQAVDYPLSARGVSERDTERS